MNNYLSLDLAVSCCDLLFSSSSLLSIMAARLGEAELITCVACEFICVTLCLWLSTSASNICKIKWHT